MLITFLCFPLRPLHLVPISSSSLTPSRPPVHGPHPFLTAHQPASAVMAHGALPGLCTPSPWLLPGIPTPLCPAFLLEYLPGKMPTVTFFLPAPHKPALVRGSPTK